MMLKQEYITYMSGLTTGHQELNSEMFSTAVDGFTQPLQVINREKDTDE